MVRVRNLALCLIFSAAALADEPTCPERLSGKNPPRYVAIVDGFSSGNMLAPLIRLHGRIPIHVQSSPRIPRDILASLHIEDFLGLKTLHESTERTLAYLRRFNVEYTIPGAESGVLLADEISEKLGLRSNVMALSRARRDKYEMAETLRAAGVRAVLQFKSADLAEILRRAPEMGATVVMKPVMSAGTDNVFFTHNDDERRTAFGAIMGTSGNGTTAYGDRNEAVLVQEYLDGPEYMVNAMSLDGEMIITDAARYEKTSANGSPAVYVGAVFVPYDELERLGIPAYLKQVQDALGFRHGPGHAEVKIVKRDGKLVPVLVEIGARMGGGGSPVIGRAACGSSQLETWIETMFRPAQFRARLGKPYNFRGGIMLCLIARREGRLIAMPYLDRIRALPTFNRWKPRVSPGEYLPLTTNFLDYPGHVELASSDHAQLERDIRQIREWEARPDFFVLESR